MSRSRKKTPIHGMTACESEKKDKRIWHKRLRTAERDRLITDPESEPTKFRQVSQIGAMGKDGKCYMTDFEKGMRK